MAQTSLNIRMEATANNDLFYSKSNMQALAESLSQLNNGNVVVKTMKELEEMVEDK